MLAGDTLRSAADLEVPMVVVTLLHRKGYFRQILEPDGRQREMAEQWEPSERLVLLNGAASISLDGRNASIRAWRCQVSGISGHVLPVYFPDTFLKTMHSIEA